MFNQSSTKEKYNSKGNKNFCEKVKFLVKLTKDVTVTLLKSSIETLL